MSPLFQEINGQIFEVDEKMLQFLDDFEEHPTVYQRVEVNVVVESGKSATGDKYPIVNTLPRIVLWIFKFFTTRLKCIFFWSWRICKEWSVHWSFHLLWICDGQLSSILVRTATPSNIRCWECVRGIQRRVSIDRIVRNFWGDGKVAVSYLGPVCKPVLGPFFGLFWEFKYFCFNSGAAQRNCCRSSKLIPQVFRQNLTFQQSPIILHQRWFKLTTNTIKMLIYFHRDDITQYRFHLFEFFYILSFPAKSWQNTCQHWHSMAGDHWISMLPDLGQYVAKKDEL